MKEIVETWPDEENENIINLWQPLEFNIDDNYEYIPKGILFSIFSNVLYYGIALPILSIFTKIVYGLRIEGKENIKKLKGGAVSISNHVLFLDCAITGVAFGFKNIHYTTQENSFKIPVVRKLIKLLKAIPIPRSISNKKNFIREIDGALQKGDIVHFYPEASLWPYYTKLRKFKNGAFDFAVRNEVPVIPVLFTFRKTKGFRRILKKKPDITLKILSPMYPEKDENVEKFKIEVHKEMEKVLLKSKEE